MKAAIVRSVILVLLGVTIGSSVCVLLPCRQHRQRLELSHKSSTGFRIWAKKLSLLEESRSNDLRAMLEFELNPPSYVVQPLDPANPYVALELQHRNGRNAIVLACMNRFPESQLLTELVRQICLAELIDYFAYSKYAPENEVILQWKSMEASRGILKANCTPQMRKVIEELEKQYE